jgi:hypothetical protein
MKFRLVDAGWDRELNDAVRTDQTNLRIVCPFLKKRAVARLTRAAPAAIRVITRFDLRTFSEGASDIAALRLLLERGARIRGVRNLHAKVYLFGTARAIVTSANLTDAALLRNHEFGFVAENQEIVGRCAEFFERLWEGAGPDLRSSLLEEWENRVNNYLASGRGPVSMAVLGDEGVDIEAASIRDALHGWIRDAEKAFVKFFGEGNNRAERTMTVLDELRSSGSHWACPYPRNRRPRSVPDGAVVFMGRLVGEPADILIYGRAIALRHVPGRDDATAEDIVQHSWKAKWPHYVRVHHPEFVSGTLENGVSLNEVMHSLGARSFTSTERNAAAGSGNLDPRMAYRQQPAVQLSEGGFRLLSERLQLAFERHGKVDSASLLTLYWPSLPPR